MWFLIKGEYNYACNLADINLVKNKFCELVRKITTNENKFPGHTKMIYYDIFLEWKVSQSFCPQLNSVPKPFI